MLSLVSILVSMQGFYGGVMDLPDVKPQLIPPTSDAMVSKGAEWEGRSIAGPKLRLKEFVSFLSTQTDVRSDQDEVRQSLRERLFC